MVATWHVPFASPGGRRRAHAGGAECGRDGEDVARAVAGGAGDGDRVRPVRGGGEAGDGYGWGDSIGEGHRVVGGCGRRVSVSCDVLCGGGNGRRRGSGCHAALTAGRRLNGHLLAVAGRTAWACLQQP